MVGRAHEDHDPEVGGDGDSGDGDLVGGLAVGDRAAEPTSRDKSAVREGLAAERAVTGPSTSSRGLMARSRNTCSTAVNSSGLSRLLACPASGITAYSASGSRWAQARVVEAMSPIWPVQAGAPTAGPLAAARAVWLPIRLPVAHLPAAVPAQHGRRPLNLLVRGLRWRWAILGSNQ